MAKAGEKFYLDARGIKASGVVTENGFTVFKGSEVRPTIAKYLNKTLVDLRNICESDGTIVDWKLTRDMDFNSPSTAAYFLFGANASGPQTWKDENGMTMLEHDKLAAGVLKDPSDREYLGFLKTVEGNEGSKCHYPTRLDTYGCGCGHDCSYCYAKDMIINMAGPEGWDPSHPKIADLWRIENRIKRGELKKGDIARLGGLTDCFQPIEKKYHTTLETIKILNKYGIGYLIVTKSHTVADDEYLEVMDPALAHIQLTTTTFDAALAAKYEKASPPDKRVAAIEKLQALGFDTFFRLSPYIDGWIDFDRLNRVKCDKILIEFLRVNTTIARRFGVSLDDFPVRDAAYCHMSLEHKLEVLAKITGFKEVRISKDLVDIIAPIYLQAAKNVNWLEGEVREGFIERYLTLLIFGVEKPTLKYIPTLYRSSSEEIRELFVSAIGHRLRELDPDTKLNWWNKWLKHFLEIRKSNKPVELTESECRSLFMLIPKLDFVLDDAINILCKGKLPSALDNLFWYELENKSFATNYSHSITKLLIALLNSITDLGVWGDYILQIVNKLQEIDDKEQKLLRDALLKHGIKASLIKIDSENKNLSA